MAFVLSEGSYPNTGANGLFSAVALSGTIIGVGSNGLILRTVDNGANWTQPTSPSTNTWHGIATDGTNFVIVGVGTGLRTAISTDDGVTWSANASADETANWQSVCYADTLGRWVAVASNGTTRTMESTNGTAWTGHAAATAKQWQGVAWSNPLGLLVASAFDASTTSLMSSTNATAWTSRTSVNTWTGTRRLAWESSVGAFAEIVDVSGGTHVVATSTTGTSGWAAQTIPNDTEALSTLTAAPSLGLFVVTKGCFPNVGNPMSLLTSDDGTTWTETEYSDIQDVFGWDAACWDESQGILFAFSGTSSSYKTLTGFWATLGVLSPSTGTKDGGTVVTITGTGLSNVAQGDVLFDGTAALSVVAAADGLSLTCITPAHAVGLVDVVITGIGTLTGAYTFVSITRITPRRGTYAGGEAVTITGFGFDLATGVTFDGISAGNIVYVSNTTITATTPVHGAGFVTVAVVGVGSLVNGYEFVIPVEKLPPYPYYTPLNQDGKANADLISGAWARWLTVVKERVENPVLSPSTQVPASSVIGVLNENNIPQLPFTRIDLTHSPRLLGRTSAGAGPAEEITVTGGLTLNNGQLSIFGLIGGFTVGDILYADSVATLARLNDVSVGSYLRSGGVATAPLWSTLKLPNAATAGSVVFASATNTYGQDNAHLFWDDANDRLGIGTASPLSTLQVNSAQTGAGATGIVNINASAVSADLNLINAMTPNMAVSNRTWINWGVSATTGNAASLGFFYAGSNNAANRVDIATWGATNPQVSIYNTGRVDITNSTSATNNNLLNVFAASSGTGTTSWLNVGVSATTGNASSIGFYYVSNNAATNRLDFAVYGAATPQLSLSNSGNVGIASTTFPATGTGGLVFSDGTALASMASNTAAIYAEDVAGTVKMFAIAEDGTGGEILTTVSTIPYTSIGSVPTATVLGRNSAGTGAAEALGTLPSAVQLNITATGALNAGSITSGFGAIDVGADSITGGAASFTTGAFSSNVTITGGSVTIDNGQYYKAKRNSGAAVVNVLGFDSGTNDLYIRVGDNGTSRLWVRNTSNADVFSIVNASGDTRTGAILSTLAGGSSIHSFTVGTNKFLSVAAASSGGLTVDGAVLGFSRASDGAQGVFELGVNGNDFVINSRVNYHLYSNAVEYWTLFGTSNTGNLGIGATTQPGGGTHALLFGQGTALSSMGSNTAGLNAVDVGGTAQIKAVNEAGESSQLTGAATFPSTISAVTGYKINAAAAAAGTFLRGDGTNYIASTLTIPNTTTANRLLYSTATSVVGESASLTFDGTTFTTLAIAGSTLSQTGLTTKYNNVNTAGWGVAAIYGAGRSNAQTAAVASVAAYTVGAADGTFAISANVNVTTSTTYNFTVAVDYTDETNTARTLTLTFSQVSGVLVTAITNLTGAGPYEGVLMHIRCKASTAITIKTVGTFTSVTYNVGGIIEQVA